VAAAPPVITGEEISTCHKPYRLFYGVLTPSTEEDTRKQ
jgi:hypothetical protein